MVEYDEIEKENHNSLLKEESVVYEPDVTYIVKNKHKVLKNTLFYLSVAVLFVLNFVFVLDMASTEFTSSIAQGVRSIFSSSQTSQNVEQNTNYINCFLSDNNLTKI